MRNILLGGASLLALTVSAQARVLSYTGSVQTYTALVAGVYDIEAFGAQGGGGPGLSATAGPGGFGADIGGDIHLSAGEMLNVFVGGRGGTNVYGYGGGGGGGSFVVAPGATPLVIAGGGGGGYPSGPGGNGLNGTSGGAGGGGSGGAGGTGGSGGVGALYGSGGGGFSGSGSAIFAGAEAPGAGYPSLAGGAAFYGASGGFGGGGGGGGGPSLFGGGGGGGGYSGGGGGNQNIGGGGGSFLAAGATSRVLIGGGATGGGDGSVDITLVSADTPVPEPASLGILAASLIGLCLIRRKHG